MLKTQLSKGVRKRYWGKSSHFLCKKKIGHSIFIISQKNILAVAFRVRDFCSNYNVYFSSFHNYFLLFFTFLRKKI